MCAFGSKRKLQNNFTRTGIFDNENKELNRKNDDIPFKGPLNEFTVINIDTFIPVIFFYIEVIPRSAFDRIVSLRKLILLFIFKVIRKNQFRSLYNHINFNWHIFTPNTYMTSFVFKCEGQIAIDSRLSLKTYTLYMFWGL